MKKKNIVIHTFKSLNLKRHCASAVLVSYKLKILINIMIYLCKLHFMFHFEQNISFWTNSLNFILSLNIIFTLRAVDEIYWT